MAEKATKPKKEAAPKVAAPEPVIPKKKELFEDWEYKTRIYRVSGRHNPAIFWLQSRPSSSEPMLYWDADKKKNRELRYAANFDTPFKDEQHGTAVPGVIMFEEGTLVTRESDVGLQKFLELHPKKDTKFYLVDKEAVAADELEVMDIEDEARALARDLDIDHIEAIMRTELRSAVDEMSTKELRREARIFAKRNPKFFLTLATDDDITMRNLAIKASEAGYINVLQDQIVWAETNRKIIDVGYDEHPYTKLVQFFKKDEGIDLMKSLQHKLAQ